MPRSKIEKILKKRERWEEEAMKIEASNFIFIDESGANLRKAIRIAFKEVSESDLINWFKCCGYEVELD